MKSTIKKITTNTRVIKDLLTNYRDTFQAFRELIGQILSENDLQLANWKSQILAAVGKNGRV
jgi:predicted ATPase